MHRRIFPISTLMFFALLFALVGGSSWATEEYAETTGQECQVCHIDPLGGGELTGQGAGYALALNPNTGKPAESAKLFSRIFRLLVGYFHIITGFLWFGTILYVHLVLKPAYASKGLPRGEVRVGLGSMIVMAVTGAVLTIYKVPSLDLFLTSRFGILLLIKISLFVIMVSSALYVVLVLGPKLKKQTGKTLTQSDRLTLAELAAFDGEDGRPAYIAYRDTIYNVNASKLWKKGHHMMRHQAGTDLTDILDQAPHGEDKILAMPVVGTLVQQTSTPAKKPLHERVFFFMAYMNLSFVFVISLILALWRWG